MSDQFFSHGRSRYPLRSPHRSRLLESDREDEAYRVRRDRLDDDLGSYDFYPRRCPSSLYHPDLWGDRDGRLGYGDGKLWTI